MKPVYNALLLKLSGEVLKGSNEEAFDWPLLESISKQIAALQKNQVKIGIMVGGGNFVRGKSLVKLGFDRIISDQVGMMGTVMNALILAEILRKHDIPVTVASAIAIDGIVGPMTTMQLRSTLAQEVVIFASGSGNPIFTTDTAAVLKAIEMKADVLFKATKVQGVFEQDPSIDPNARLLPKLSYDAFIQNRFAVMDTTAMTICQEYDLPVRIFDFSQTDVLLQAISGKSVGTKIEGGSKDE